MNWIRRISPEARAFYGGKACRRRPVPARASDEDDSDQIETPENVTESSRQLGRNQPERAEPEAVLDEPSYSDSFSDDQRAENLLEDMAERIEEYKKQAQLADECLRVLAEERKKKELREKLEQEQEDRQLRLFTEDVEAES